MQLMARLFRASQVGPTQATTPLKSREAFAKLFRKLWHRSEEVLDAITERLIEERQTARAAGDFCDS